MPSHPTSIWRRSPNKLRQSEIWLECFYFTSLFLAALILFLVNLGNLPLLDSNEGTVAQVAKEIYQGSDALSNWIFPTLWGEPYLAQPPLVHDLIAIAYKLGGVSEFTTRLPGALLAASSVIFVYNIGREIFIARFPALCSALVYLTCLPVVRFGRLAMSDGPLLCFELLTIWAILRSRRDLKWSLVAGIGLGLIGLTQGIVSLQILAIVGGFLWWDTPRLLTSPYFLRGLILGVTPGLGWYICQWFHYYEFQSTESFISLFLGQSSSGLELNAIEGPISAGNLDANLSLQYFLTQSLQYIVPWFMVAGAGLKLASRNVHWGWGKLVVVWIGFYLTLIFLTFNWDYYWSILLIYPALALVAGIQLDLIRNLPSYADYPRLLTYSFALMAALSAFAGLHWGIRNYIDFYLPFVCGSLAITFAATAIVLAQQEKQFIPLLFWGLFVSIFLLMVSPHWIWELKSVEPVKPIAELIRQHTPENQVIYTSMVQERSSLDFYSDRQVVVQKTDDLKDRWQHDRNVYLLLDSQAVKDLQIPLEKTIKDSQFDSLNWILAIKKY
ncbi:glycosyltransferase family 39 protein [Waterburya agarophytonicola K14]|uniref:Glycosyltransferase family 39 protein n=1 Tax=Waterburya agarophytonicola KI4 TaxID=2874699 RepID=A0A964BP14_9CYAN|nr:glycosyltransferase family 39 protein [Waterburya agarophytonicola]MCC0176943.1 glycosyltransferase family 39 protein [Waterburya agarophytonicola KI4]